MGEGEAVHRYIRQQSYNTGGDRVCTHIESGEASWCLENCRKTEEEENSWTKVYDVGDIRQQQERLSKFVQPANAPPTTFPPPTMVRYKARYLLINIYYPGDPISASTSPSLSFSHPSDPALTPQVLSSLLRDSLATQFGDYGAGIAGNLSVKYFSPVTSTGIIRVGRDHYRTVWAALTFMKDVSGRPAVIRVARVSGTIKKVQMEAISMAKKGIERAAGVGGDGVGLDAMDIVDPEDDEEEEEED